MVEIPFRDCAAGSRLAIQKGSGPYSIVPSAVVGGKTCWRGYGLVFGRVVLCGRLAAGMESAIRPHGKTAGTPYSEGRNLTWLSRAASRLESGGRFALTPTLSRGHAGSVDRKSFGGRGGTRGERDSGFGCERDTKGVRSIFPRSERSGWGKDVLAGLWVGFWASRAVREIGCRDGIGNSAAWEDGGNAVVRGAGTMRGQARGMSRWLGENMPQKSAGSFAKTSSFPHSPLRGLQL